MNNGVRPASGFYSPHRPDGRFLFWEGRLNYDKIHLCDRRSRLRTRQGNHGGFTRSSPEGARTQGRRSEARPLHQRRPRHDEPLSARRGLCHRGRRRDRPRPRSLRALHRREPQQVLEPHDRQGLLERPQQGAPRRISRLNRAGHPAHHERDQGIRLQRRKADRRGCRHHRNRRHDRRHRVSALPRGGAPDLARGRTREQPLHPRHVSSLPARLG